MNEKGQVHFDASDKEVPQEDKVRYEEALEKYRAGVQRHVEELCEREAIGGDSYYCRRRPQPKEESESWIPEGADLEEVKDQIDQAARAREQKEE